MLALLRRDPLISSRVAKKGLFVALNAGVLAGLATFLAASTGARTLGPIALILALLAILIWLSLIPLLLVGKVNERCLPFDMAMPISARRLWLAHVIALVSFGLMLLALTGGVLLLLFRALHQIPAASTSFPQALASLALPMAAVLILVVVLLQCMHPSLYRVPRTRKYVLYSILIACLALGLILTLAVLPPWTVFAPLALALWIGYRTYHSVPPAFSLVPFASDAPDASAVPDPGAAAGDLAGLAGSGPPGSMALGGLLFRVLYHNPSLRWYWLLAFYPLLFLLGVIFSGFMAVWKDIELPQLAWLFLTAYLMLSALPAHLFQLQFMSLLPISRRRLLSFLMLPGLVAVSLGYGGGSAGKALVQSSRLMVKYQTESSSLLPTYASKYPQVRVPGQYFEIAWDGKVPESGSPWGETHPLRQDPLYSGSRIAVYSPFSTPQDSSPQFAALQISRAIQAVYGRSVPYGQVLERYLEVKDNVSVGLKDGGAAILQDYPDLVPVREIPLFPIAVVLIGVSWFLMAALYFRACRATITDAGRKGVFYALLAVVLLVNIAPVPGLILGLFRLEVVDAFLRILIRQAVDFLPGGVLTVWILCAAALAGAYLPAKAQFGRIELILGRPCR
jgi:hypothetical protein